MRGLGAGLAVTGVINDQHPPLVRGRGRVAQQQLEPALVDPVGVPGRLRQKPLQPLHGRMLGANDRFGAGQRGQGLVAVARQQQALQVGAEATALGQRAQQPIELSGVVLQWTGCGRAGQPFGHREPLERETRRLSLPRRKPP
jgi:hypothetical protein